MGYEASCYRIRALYTANETFDTSVIRFRIHFYAEPIVILSFSPSLRIELAGKHAKHVSDLKLYYEHEIDELKSQLNRLKMG